MEVQYSYIKINGTRSIIRLSTQRLSLFLEHHDSFAHTGPFYDQPKLQVRAGQEKVLCRPRSSGASEAVYIR